MISTHSLTKRLTELDKKQVSCQVISTHSLTKRLTMGCPVIVISGHDFNSQPHEEADSNSAQKFLVQNCFFATITYIAFSVHLSFNFLRIFSS